MQDRENDSNNQGDEDFGLPDGYFERSAASIMNRIELSEEMEAYPELAKAGKENGLTIPEGYFNESALLLTDCPMLLSLDNKPGFTAPENYFDQLESRLSSRLTDKTLDRPAEGRIIRLFNTRLIAAAAVLTIIAGAWMFSYFSPAGTESDCGTVACIEKKDILKSKTIEGLENEDLIDMIDADRLQQRLDGELKPDGNDTNFSDMDPGDI
jgi:hypothetical protein